MTEEYLHGHAEAVLRSHRWRTAENSAPHLLSRLGPAERILDVGCGPGTITADLARRVPAGSVTGVDRVTDVLEEARVAAAGVGNVAFRAADVYDLPFRDGAFDVVHAHQVLQHLADPVAALREMVRVARPGGIVAVRDADYGAFTWAPAEPGLDLWSARYRQAARSLGAEPDAGRHLLGWCLRAGLTDCTASASVWCFAGEEDRAWWGRLWEDRLRASDLGDRMRAAGAGDGDLDGMVEGWRAWSARPDGWFAVLHGEVVGRPPG
jgi:SAM-dependent methyltransferase